MSILSTRSRFQTALLIGATVFSGLVITVETNAKQLPSWSPRVSEKLVKLPGDFMRKAVDNDFSRSQLAVELGRIGDDVALKRQTLADLKDAIQRADGDLRVELEHQFLAEKREFIGLMREQQEVLRRRANTKIELYGRLLQNLNRSKRNMTPEKSGLVSKQLSARSRFESAVAEVDTKFLAASVAGESKYAREYTKNLSAIRSLTEALKFHSMNTGPEVAGVPVSRAEYLRQLVAESEGAIALLEQEGKILGYMAKLVSLDALALVERSIPSNTIVEDQLLLPEPGPAGAINLFVPSHL